jgi:hypothetical protein
MKTDAEKCRLIAEFEGIYPNDILTSDYPHDLNATMRAARRLQRPMILVVTSEGRAAIVNANEQFDVRSIKSIKVDGDPARAAFEALSQYLETAKEK